MLKLNNESSIQKWIEVLSTQKHSVTPSDLSKLLEDLLRVQQMEQTNQLLSALLECLPEGIEITDADGNILYVNENLEKITGIKNSMRLGKNIFDVNPNSLLVKALTERKEISDSLTTAPEMNKEVVATASPIFSNGKLIGAMVLIRDITQVIQLAKQLKQTTKYLHEMYNKNSTRYSFSDILGKSSNIQSVIQLAKKVAPTDSTVLIEGENGTGKELFAHSIHAASLRCDKPFLRVNCAAIPEQLLESEFFGHEKGAFTGAIKTKVGIFELASGGTLFLDEIGDMPLSLQAKLLRVLQEGEIRRIGGSDTIKVDVRIIAATNRDLKQMVNQGLFREDLYYRLNVITLRIPSLRERTEDIPELVEFFIRKYNKKTGKMVKGIEPEAIQALRQHSWPGNVRELENVIEYAILTAEGEMISLENITPKIPIPANNYVSDEIMSLEAMERRLIEKALTIYGDTLQGKKQAAEALGISLATLYNKIKKYSNGSHNESKIYSTI
ncbi:sigma-54 interaction domain-containing protein [Parageobacillus thermoglucosidasius]|uniref:sigma-54 interaction domain-containing protein n=1 Tax=Parageobacillus thermoglucosidasius TaxID=1426 RepID=UPI00241D356D|nr:sigma 54-interacting transcriptional regulator [Parageobacillus thermoglucosidasius]